MVVLCLFARHCNLEDTRVVMEQGEKSSTRSKALVAGCISSPRGGVDGGLCSFIFT